MKRIVNWFKNEESGQGMVEYALILAFIAVACIAAFRLLGTNISNKANNVSAALQ